jgi:hypothetical protein
LASTSRASALAGHVLDQAELGRVDAQEPAPGAGVLVDTGRAVGAVALTECDLAEREVVLELGPLLPRHGPLRGERPRRAPLLDEVLMRSDHLLGEHGRKAASGVEVEVTEQGRGDVQR